MSVKKLSLRKKIALMLFRQFKRNEVHSHQLSYILWESTLKCNLNCLHCGSDCSKDAMVADMPAKDFLRAIDEIVPIVSPNNTTIVFTGGEALMRNDLEEVGLELYKRGFPWGIVTNGALLNAKRLELLVDNGMRAATVSLDGLEASHNWLRNNSKSFDGAVKAIALLSLTNLRYDVVTCVTQKNYNELAAIRDLLIANFVKEWRIFTIFPIGRAKENEELQLEPKQFKELFDFIKQTRLDGKIKVNYGCEGYLGNLEGEVRDNFFFCRAGVSIASILADGSISACPNLRSNFIQGNIYSDNFAQVWQQKYQKYRNRSWMKIGQCKTCKEFKNCQGSGMHLRDEESGELLFCHLNRIAEGEMC